MTEAIRRADLGARPLHRPSGIGRPRAGRREGLADVQPRRHRHASQPGRDGDRPRKCRPARGEMAVPGQGLGPGDRGHPCHAHRRGRLRLFRHGHGSDLLQALARWEGAMVVPPQSGSRGGTGRIRVGEERCKEPKRPLPGVTGRHHGLGAGDRGHGLLRRRRRLVLRAGPGDRGRALEAQCASQGLPRLPPDQRLHGLADPRRGQADRRRRHPRTAPGRRALLSWLVGPGLRHGPGAEDRPDRVEVRRRPQARALEPPDHDQG